MFDKENLIHNQYKSPVNLNARIDIHERFSTNKSNFFTWLFSQYSFDEASDILEVGCGTGSFWLENFSKLPRECKLTLTDFSEGMLNSARERLAERPIQFSIADVENLPFENSSFDCVLAHFMLYHPSSPLRAIQEIRRVLKPSGFLGAVTNGQHHMIEIDELANAIGKKLGLPSFPRMGDPFREENGEALLKTCFGSVEKVVREDGLNITEVEPAVNYVKSQYFSHLGEYQDEFFRDYTESVCNLVSKSGSWSVTKRTVLFICRP